MATRVISSVHKDFTETTIVDHVNDLTGASHNDIAALLTTMGISTAGPIIEKFVVEGVAKKLLSTLSRIGWGVTLATIVSLIEDERLKDERNEVIQEVRERGGKIRVYTEYVEWSSGSGNHYTYYTRTRYARVA